MYLLFNLLLKDRRLEKENYCLLIGTYYRLNSVSIFKKSHCRKMRSLSIALTHSWPFETVLLLLMIASLEL